MHVAHFFYLVLVFLFSISPAIELSGTVFALE